MKLQPAAVGLAFALKYLQLWAPNKNSQSCLWERSAPPPPSSCTQSEHRSGPAARSDPCSDVSSGCPADRCLEEQHWVTQKRSTSASSFMWPLKSAYIKVHFLTIRNLGSAGPRGGKGLVIKFCLSDGNIHTNHLKKETYLNFGFSSAG